jgi:predicted extracellular nuclease
MCHLPLLSGATIILALLAPAARAAELYAAFWNVENLFDTVDDQAVRGDEDFTPEGKKAWTEQRLQAKLGRLAGVVRRMNGGKGPDVLAVAEVENRRVVEMLSAELVASTATSPGRSYKVVHQDSPSERGIDVAILYDERKLELKGAKFHRVDAANTRDVVEAEFAVAGRPFHLLANHWPSRAHDASFRVRAARVVRKRLDELLAADAKADVLVVGDLNDHPADQSVADALGTSRTPEGATGGTFYNTAWALQDAGRGTYVYDNAWEVLDHAIVSPGLLDPAGLRWRPGSTSEVRFRDQIFTPRDAQQIPRPNRTYSGDKHHPTGISDHLPIGCVLEY